MIQLKLKKNILNYFDYLSELYYSLFKKNINPYFINLLVLNLQYNQ